MTVVRPSDDRLKRAIVRDRLERERANVSAARKALDRALTSQVAADLAVSNARDDLRRAEQGLSSELLAHSKRIS